MIHTNQELDDWSVKEGTGTPIAHEVTHLHPAATGKDYAHWSKAFDNGYKANLMFARRLRETED